MTADTNNIFVETVTDKNGRETNRPNMKEVLTYFQTNYVFKTSSDIEAIYYYKDGIYTPAEIMIKSELEKMLAELATSHFVEETLNHIRRSSYITRNEFNKHQGEIPVKNGLLDLKTTKLSAFTPQKIWTYKINADYNLNADCPKYKKFLDEILPKDDQQCLQEYCGYTLLAAMPFYKILWLYGIGRNGKGRIVLTMQAILGRTIMPWKL
jgi:phage/plasmid-associated DNA primase